jgi:hypothetical protein
MAGTHDAISARLYVKGRPTHRSPRRRIAYAGRMGSPSGAAPRAGKALALRTLTMPRRARMRVDDTCHAHRCAGRAVRQRGSERPRRAGGVASPRPLSRVIRDSLKSASQVSRSTAAMSTLSAYRPTPSPNSRLTGDRRTPNRRRHRQARTGEADFPRGEREQDAIPPVRRSLSTGAGGESARPTRDHCSYRDDGSPCSSRSVNPERSIVSAV